MQVGFIGVGAMGAFMAGHVAARGHAVRAYDTDPEALARCTDGTGVAAAADVAEIARACEVVVVMVASDAQSRSVVEALIAAGASPGATIVVAATNHPRTMIDLAAFCRDAGIGFVDAPVVYGLQGAKKGELVSLCGGAADDIARARPVLECYSRSVEHIGGPGYGQLAKTCNNMMHWVACVANYEVLALARACGAEAQAMREVLLKCPARNTTLERWDTTRFTWHQKDMDVALELSQEAGVSLPLMGLVDQLVKRLGPDDVAALLRGPAAAYLGLPVPEGKLEDIATEG